MSILRSILMYPVKAVGDIVVEVASRGWEVTKLVHELNSEKGLMSDVDYDMSLLGRHVLSSRTFFIPSKASGIKLGFALCPGTMNTRRVHAWNSMMHYPGNRKPTKMPRSDWTKHTLVNEGGKIRVASGWVD